MRCPVRHPTLLLWLLPAMLLVACNLDFENNQVGVGQDSIDETTGDTPVEVLDVSPDTETTGPDVPDSRDTGQPELDTVADTTTDVELDSWLDIVDLVDTQADAGPVDVTSDTGTFDVTSDTGAVDVTSDTGTFDVTSDTGTFDVPVEVADTTPDTSPVCANPSGHDEDQDGIDDVCDNCPSIPNAAQENSDADLSMAGGVGVGDVCEAPDPDNSDRIVVFDPFTSNTGRWTGGTAWTQGTDLVTGNSGPRSNYTHDENLSGGPFSVETTFVQHADPTNTEGLYVCVFFGHADISDETFMECCYEWHANRIGVWEAVSGTYTPLVSVDAEVLQNGTEPEWRRIRADYDGTHLSCRLENAWGLDESVTLAVSNNLSGVAGIRVVHTEADFHSYTVYVP